MKEKTFRSPGYHDNEYDLSEAQKLPLGISAGIVGTAERGPAFVPVVVGSLQDFETRFGNLDAKRYGPYAVNEFLKHRSAITYMRVLGAGANNSGGLIGKYQSTDQVFNAGFVVTGALGTDTNTNMSTHRGCVQFIVARHATVGNEAYGMPMFTDNSSVTAATPTLVRAMVMMASASRLCVAGGAVNLSAASWATLDDAATPNASGEFKLIVSSTLGAAFATTDGLPGIKVFTASLDPGSANYVGKLLNTNPENFVTEQHCLYGDFAVDAEVCPAATSVGAVQVLSGSALTSGVSGDGTMNFREVFGHFDTRYRAPITPYIISQPFGTTEYDLFKVEALDDGAYANTRYKVTIANVKKSTDPKNDYGTFTLLVRRFDDTDPGMVVLEQFSDLTLDPDSDRYVARVIGDKKIWFNFDAESESERRLIVSGKYANKSAYVRVVMNADVEDKKVPAKSLPFGFRGYPTLKTNDKLVDSSTIAPERLGGIATTVSSSAIMPPIPLRFKVTRGNVATSGLAGQPGTSEVVDASYTWGVKFERSTTVLNPNPNSEANALVKAHAQLLGLKKLDALVTGSSCDTFNNNKFTLARVAFANTSLSDFTASIGDHMLEAAYIRNGAPTATDYRISDGVKSNRMTLATLAALTSSAEFNRFAQFNKFSLFMAGGFDGVNILDKDANRMNDKASSFDAGAGTTFTSPGMNSNANGKLTNNNIVNSYRFATKIMTDELTSDINLLAIPGIRESFVTDYAMRRVKEYGLAMYVMDVEQYDDNTNRVYDDTTARPDVDKTADKFASRAVDNSYTAVYFPDVRIDDTENNRRVKVPSSVAALGALAFNDRVAYPWYAPAGFNRASLDFVKTAEVRINANDRDTLQDARINPIVSWPREGYVIFGQKTLQYANTALNRVNVRRLMVEVKRQIKGVAQSLVFEGNTPAQRQKFVKDAILRLGFIQANFGVEKFSVVMDDTNNTQEDVVNNRINGRIVVVPTRTIEDIVMDFIITNSGVTFV